MVEVKASVGYMQSDGRMTIDTLVKNTDTSSLVIAFDFYSTDVPRRYLTSVSYCIPPFGTSGCVNVRIGNIPFKDPYIVQVRRCISGPNCGANSCTTFSGIVDSSFTGEVVRYDGVIPSQATYTVPSDCVPCQPSWSCESPLNGYEYERCTGQRRPNPACATVTVLNMTGVTAELSVSDLFPGSQGWVRINVTATGSGNLSILVDNVQLLTDGPLNFGTTPFTVTYLQQLSPGTKNICVQAIGGNKVCTSIVVPSPVVRKDSCLTINTRNTPPFSKGENIAIYGVLEECGLIVAPDINNAPITIKIKIDSTEVKSYSMTTYVSTSIGENWSYVWPVPAIYGTGLDTAGKNITVEVYYYGDATHNPIATSKVIGTIAAPPLPPTPLTMSTDKTSIVGGDKITIHGTYKPNEIINIYYQTVVVGIAAPCKNHLAQVVTDSTGTYSTTMAIEVYVPGTIRIGACTPPLLSVLCIDCGDVYSNTVDVQVSYIPPTPFVLKADKVSITSGDAVTFSGSYKPNTLINIFVEGVLRNVITQVTTDSSGNFSKSAPVTIEGNIQVKACLPSSIPGIVCDPLGDISNTINMAVTKLITPLVLKADKASITSGDAVTFTGTYKPNEVINIFHEETIVGVPIRENITQITVQANGTFTVIARPVSTDKVTWNVQACTAGGLLVYECSLFPDKSNVIQLTINPKVVVPPLPPPPPVLPGVKWACDPKTGVCSQPTDGSGTYATEAECKAACKKCEGTLIAGRCYSDTELALGAVIVLGGIYLVASRKGQ